MLKKDSQDWLKVGAAVAVGAVIAYGIVKATRKKKVKNTEKALEVLEKEGLLNDELKNRLTKPKSSSFWPTVTQRLLILGLALAKDKIYNELFSGNTEQQAVEKDK
ncbi:hypothetical protein ACFPIK_14510 [Algoriphagus aquatilis]|uniref:YtxH domain-containing protein n=1 Tax=Algoriphagus aquatilis TaxID=490186 RepID=A0ABW0C0X0_9BACT